MPGSRKARIGAGNGEGRCINENIATTCELLSKRAFACTGNLQFGIVGDRQDARCTDGSNIVNRKRVTTRKRDIGAQSGIGARNGRLLVCAVDRQRAASGQSAINSCIDRTDILFRPVQINLRTFTGDIQ